MKMATTRNERPSRTIAPTVHVLQSATLRWPTYSTSLIFDRNAIKASMIRETDWFCVRHIIAPSMQDCLASNQRRLNYAHCTLRRPLNNLA